MFIAMALGLGRAVPVGDGESGPETAESTSSRVSVRTVSHGQRLQRLCGANSGGPMCTERQPCAPSVPNHLPRSAWQNDASRHLVGEPSVVIGSSLSNLQGIRLVHRAVGKLGLVLIIRHLLALRTHLKHGRNLLLGHGLGVVHIVLSELFEVARKEENAELKNGQATEDGSLVLFELGNTRLVLFREVPMVDSSGVVVHVMVVLAERVVLTVDDAGRVNHRDALALRVKLHEAVESEVQERKEESHADEWLDVDEEEEGEALRQEQHRCGHVKPVLHAASAQLVVHALPSGLAKVDEGGVSRHVKHDAVDIEHEVGEG
mmetsp:Transcript_23917/g.64741  ORF Transcript_23917/g.64741 Transcript_23917/m.64741 type:complete len:319 (+) Transcript_23917:148-1104(+)